MLKEKLNEKILKAYIESSTSWKCAGAYFVIYFVAVSFLLAMVTRVNANNIISCSGAIFMYDLLNAIRAVSTAAALVSVGIGAILKKLSSRKPDRRKKGNKLIVYTIIAWVIIIILIIIVRFFYSHFWLGNNDYNFDQSLPK